MLYERGGSVIDEEPAVTEAPEDTDARESAVTRRLQVDITVTDIDGICSLAVRYWLLAVG